MTEQQRDVTSGEGEGHEDGDLKNPDRTRGNGLSRRDKRPQRGGTSSYTRTGRKSLEGCNGNAGAGVGPHGKRPMGGGDRRERTPRDQSSCKAVQSCEWGVGHRDLGFFSWAGTQGVKGKKAGIGGKKEREEVSGE